MMPFPISDPQTDEAINARKRHKKWQDATARIAALEGERGSAVEAVQSLRAELREAMHDATVRGHSTSRRVEELSDKVREAEAKVEGPWADRIAAARSAADSLGNDYAAYVDANFDVLHLEFRPDAEAARDRIVTAVDELADAFAAYRDVAGRVDALRKLARLLDARDVAAPPMQAPGTRRSFHAVSPRVEDPTPRMQERLSDDLDQALPLPLVSDYALQWRRDRLAGVPVPPSTLVPSF